MKPAFLLLPFFVCAAQTGPVVTVTGGQIRGMATPDGGAAFKGIPYARPPLGELRWREPQPVAAWTVIRDAAAFSVACTQLSEGWNMRYVPSSAEDCLYLNVAAPVWPPTAKAPVMVWVHGGSNTAGSGEAAGFDQRTLVRRGLVLVTINYRLGALGFLAHPALARESAHHASGNYGLMDQIAALQWVRKNIAAFGGDPDRVTVAGQSAGAMDVSLLMTSPLARGLFRSAIAESGAVSVFQGSRTRGEAEELGRKLAAELKMPDGDAIARLRQVPPVEILEAAKRATGGDRTGLETSVDGWVLPKPPTEIFAAGGSLAVPLMIGSTAQEIGGDEPAAKIASAIQKAYGGLADRALALYGLAGGGEGKPDPLYGGPGVQWPTDEVFRCPVIAEAVAHAAAGRLTYQYGFDHGAPDRPGNHGMGHSAELNYVFGTWGRDVQLAPIDRRISEQMQSYWTNFVRAGDPNGEGLPRWPSFAAKEREYIAFTDDGAVVKAGLRREFCEVFMEHLAGVGK
ncbi:MAG: carboxylesterase family protein [Bryobacteraceae bacterium]|jgi:para-nitrobenzyl esterase